MRTGIMAGAGCPPELMKRAAQPDEMNMTGIVSVYGQTESSPGSTMSAWTDSLELRTETVGYDFPHVECKIIDPETGKEVPDGENGEFCSRGYNTMKGYYKMPEATAQAIDADGWLHTGDLGSFDESGYLRVVGRIKDIIVRGGENISPSQIEALLLECPEIRDVQCVGVPDRIHGEEIAAFVILKDGAAMTPQQVKDHVGTHLARYKIPKYVFFTDQFPMNAAGKVLKRDLSKLASELIRE